MSHEVNNAMTMGVNVSFRQIAGNTGWLAFDRVIRMLVGITIGAWVARYLGPASFGELSYALAFLAIFQNVTSLGLDLVVAQKLPENPEQAHVVLGTVLRLRLCAGVIGIFLACIGVSLSRAGDTEALSLTAILGCCLLFQPADLIDLWFQAKTESKRSVVPRLISYGIANMVRIALIFDNAPLWAFAGAYLIESVITVILLYFSYGRLPADEDWLWSSQVARSLLKRSWPLLMSGLSIILYMRIDQLLLVNLASAKELGVYSAILPFSQAWNFIPVTLCASATPYLVKLYFMDRSECMHRFKQLFSLLIWISILISLLVALLSRPIVELFLGDKYAEAHFALSVHVFCNIPIFWGVAQTLLFNITGKTKVILIQTMIGLAASIAFNLLLIPAYGALGAAYASVIAFFVSVISSSVVFARDMFSMQLSSMGKLNVKNN